GVRGAGDHDAGREPPDHAVPAAQSGATAVRAGARLGARLQPDDPVPRLDRAARRRAALGAPAAAVVAARGRRVIGVHRLSRRYGSLVALDDVAFDVAAGQIVGLLGANGAGKSTLMRICGGLQTPDGGSVTIAGHDLWRDPLTARQHLGYMAEEPMFYDELSALEYLSFLSGLRGLDPADSSAEARRLLDHPRLLGPAGQPLWRYSHCKRKKV